MLLIILKIALLLGAIVKPLRPQKSKQKIAAKISRKENTDFSQYAISENGILEERTHCH